MDAAGIAQAGVGLVLLAIAPGYAWSHALLPRLSRLERAATAIGLSVALVVLGLYLGSAVAGIAVSSAHAIWWSIALTLGGAAVGLARRERRAGARRPT